MPSTHATRVLRGGRYGTVIAVDGEGAGGKEGLSVGHLLLFSRTPLAPYLDAFQNALGDLGYVEGKNLIIEYRSADGRRDKLADVARELIRLNVDVIVAGINEGIAAAKEATSTIPIVVVYGADSVGSGFIASLQRPGGNVTGGAWEASPQINGKSLGFLKEVVPSASRVAYLWNPDFPGVLPFVEAIRRAGRRLGLTLQSVEVRTVNDFEGAFASMIKARPDALMVVPDPLTFARRVQIVGFTAQNRLPAIGSWSEFVDAGGLMSYGANLRDYWRRAAVYVDKIFKGAKPADLPVEELAKFELMINLKTARALGLTIPPSLLAQADKVIE
jgi:putative tryptophan/tyrosine transport system substrate-binding protein